MPVYRGLLRNERVAIWRRMTADDGMCGTIPSYGVAPIIPRYMCRLYFSEEEKPREATGEERKGAWTMFGSPKTGTGASVDIQEGDKVVRANGQEFIITSLRRPLDGRVEHHLRCILRKVEGGSSSN